MKNNDLIYDWIDFLAEQRSVRKRIINEQAEAPAQQGQAGKVYKASDTNPKEVAAFKTDFQYVMGSGDSVKVVGNPIPMSPAKLICAATGKLIATVQFHSNYIKNLQDAYQKGTTKGYCPTSAGGYNPRKIRNANSLKLPPEQRSLSNHSFGVAIDFEPSKNPFVANNHSDMEDHPEFIQAFESEGFVWLGDGAGRSGKGHPGDDMHFEIGLNGVPATEQDEQGQDTQTYGADPTKVFKQAYTAGTKQSQSPPTIQSPPPPMNESFERKIFSINDESEEKLYSKYKKYFDSLLEHLRKKLKLTEHVKINLINDKKNGDKVLGKTGSYINHKDKIIVYTTGRHVKDIMRSMSHELVHHSQNIRGEFRKHHKTVHGYAQIDKHLRDMEKEAYLKGNILFRDWEDNYKYRGDK